MVEALIGQSSLRGPVSALDCDHEEADTRLILHGLEALESRYERLILMCNDTDVLLLAVHFFGKDAEVYMMGGTSKEKKCYSVQKIAESLSPVLKDNLLSFHAFTGSDTTSSFSGFGKRKCWKVFSEHPQLLEGIGRDGPYEGAEKFVCRLYNTPQSRSADEARHDIFSKGKKGLELLPPTSNALSLHIARANYQAKIWLQSDKRSLALEPAWETDGWTRNNNGLQIVWMTKPAIPEACIELIACNCKSQCQSRACKCRRTEQICMPECTCNSDDCCNPYNMDH